MSNPSEPECEPSPASACFFSTIRLNAALPPSFELGLGLQFYAAGRRPHPSMSSAIWLEYIRKKIFLRYDHALDGLQFGPPCFQSSACIEAVLSVANDISSPAFRVLALNVLPNHVHLITQTEVPARIPAGLTYDQLPAPALRQFIEAFQQESQAKLAQFVAPEGAGSGAFIVKPTESSKPDRLKLWYPGSFDFQIQGEQSLVKTLRYMADQGNYFPVSL